MPANHRGPHTFEPGDRVRLAGQFLRNTGQTRGGEGGKIWTVRAIDGDGGPGTAVVTDERHTDEYIRGYWTEAEIAADPNLAYRRILAVNLVRYGMPSSRDVC